MELTTERLTLREFNHSDAPALLAYQSDPLFLQRSYAAERSAEEIHKLMRRFLADQHAQPRIKFQLALVLTSSQQVIGTCGIRMQTADASEGDIGYELAPQYWGQGYATEAARAIVEFGYTQLKLHRIWAWCIAENVGSATILQKLDMQAEGRKRENEYFEGRWWDTLLFGLLDYEWESLHKSKSTDTE